MTEDQIIAAANRYVNNNASVSAAYSGLCRICQEVFYSFGTNAEFCSRKCRDSFRKFNLKQFCIQGHDTFACGRVKSGGCRICSATRTNEYIKERIFTPEEKEALAVSKHDYYMENEGKNHPLRPKKNPKATQENHKKRYDEEPLYKLSVNLRIRLNAALKSKFWKKTTHFAEYIGCTQEELKVHLENQFTPGMNWNNHTTDGWHADHVTPLSSAATLEEMYKLCHYTNLQPLWADANYRKGSKLPSELNPPSDPATNFVLNSSSNADANASDASSATTNVVAKAVAAANANDLY